MNIWSRLLLHLRRARLRQRFMKDQERLQEAFRKQLLQDTSQQQQWHDLQWLTEPILHVVADPAETPVALVGIVAITTSHEEKIGTPVTQSQTGTAVFYYEAQGWQSQGKVLLQMTPAEVFQQLCHKSMSY